MPEQVYDPRVSAIKSRVVNPPDPEELAKNAVKFGILHLDEVMPAGMNATDGEFITIKGIEGERKTTLACNIVRNVCRAGSLNGWVIWDTLESGASPVKVKDALIAMEAAAILAVEIWGGINGLPMTSPQTGTGAPSSYRYANMKAICERKDEKTGRPIFSLGARRLLGTADRLPIVQAALDKAEANVDAWPLYIFGAPEGQGGTKRMTAPVNGNSAIDDHDPYRRWKKWVEKGGAKMIVVDHSSAYAVPQPYDRITKFVTHGSSIVAEKHVVMIAIAQTALSTGRKYEVGGPMMAQEASISLETKYNRAKPYNLQVLPDKVRDEPPVNMNIPIEPSSGLLFPFSYPRRTRR